MFENVVEEGEITKVEYYFCFLGGHLEQTHGQILTFMLEKYGKTFFDILFLKFLEEGVLENFVSILRQDIGKSIRVGFSEVHWKFELT